MPVRGRGMCNAARRAMSGRFCVRSLLCDCPGRPCGVSSNTRKVSHGSCCHILTPPSKLRLQPVLSDGCTRLSFKNPFCPDGRTECPKPSGPGGGCPSRVEPALQVNGQPDQRELQPSSHNKLYSGLTYLLTANNVNHYHYVWC